MTLVAIIDDIHDAMPQQPAFDRLRARGVQVVNFTHRLTAAERPAALRDVDVVVPLRERSRLDDAWFADAPNLKFVAQTGRAGPHIDREAATRRGILIAEGWSSRYAPTTAELAITLMQVLMKGVLRADADLRRGEWNTPMGISMMDKTLGLLGFGRLGGHTAKIALAFGMKVQVWSRSMTPERAAAAGATAVGLEELMATSDVVSNHLALNEGTRGLIDARLLSLMKPTAYFINTARAETTDENALVDLLQQRKIAGAGLDVFMQEPLPAGHPLTKLDNVVLMPHAGWPADIGYESFAQGVVPCIEAWLDGELRNVVNPEAAANHT